MTRPLAVLALIALAAAAPAEAQTKAAPKAAPATQAQPSPPPGGGRYEQGVWVPEGNTLAEVLEQQDANREMAEFAARQVAENEAGIAADARARAEYEAELARIEAETARSAAEYERKMAAWRAAVAACQAGDASSCGPTPEK